MKQIYLSGVLSSFLLSCTVVHIDYLGSEFPRTEQVDVFINEAAIAKPYSIVGKGYIKAMGYSYNRAGDIQKEAVKKAKTKGADAVLILEHYTPNTTTGISSVYKTDSTGNGSVLTGNTTITRSGTRSFSVHFIKYKM